MYKYYRPFHWTFLLFPVSIYITILFYFCFSKIIFEIVPSIFEAVFQNNFVFIISIVFVSPLALSTGLLLVGNKIGVIMY